LLYRGPTSKQELPVVPEGEELLLSLADEPETATPSAAAPPAHSPSPAQKAGAPAIAKAKAGKVPSRSSATKSRGPLIQGVLLALIVLACGGGYWVMSRQSAMTLPALTAPVTGVPQVAPEGAAEGTVNPPPAATQTHAPAFSVDLDEPVADEPDPVPPRHAQTPAPAAVQEAPVASEPAPVVAAAPIAIRSQPSPLPAAHAALRSGNLQRAEQLYRETLAGEPDQPDAHLGLALIDQSRNATTSALAHYRVVLSQRSTDAQAWAGIADLAADSELDAMESRLRDLLGTRQDAALHFALGNILVRQSRWSEAQESFFAAVTAVPGNADYAFNVAVALDRLGKQRAAATYYSRAVELAAENRGVQFDVAAARARATQLQAVKP
jgi:Tfp pilus assembly protein PilF